MRTSPLDNNVSRHRRLLRVLLIGPYPMEAGKIVGGIEAVNSVLAPALASQEFVSQVTVLGFYRGPESPRREKINEKLQVLYVKDQKKFMVLTRAFFNVLIARRIASEINPDVVHGQGIGPPGYVATKLGRPSVVTTHGMVHIEQRARAIGRNRLKGTIRTVLVKEMVKSTLSAANLVISISDYDARVLRDFIRGHQVRIYNPIAPEFFNAPSEMGDPNKVLFAGVIRPRKNLEGLLRGFQLIHKRVPSARLRIVGPAPFPDHYRAVREFTTKLGMDPVVDFIGHVDNDRLIQELRTSRVVTLFSNEETSPTILAQAMALAKPVVASRVGGVPEMLLDGEAGFLVEPQDEFALADRLITLLQSSELCLRMGSTGREIARARFGPGAVARKTVEAYRIAVHS